MKLNSKLILNRSKSILLLILVFGIIPGYNVDASSLDERSVILESSVPSEVTDYTFEFIASSITPIRSLVVEVCEEVGGACNIPPGFSAASATLNSQPDGFGASSGWSVDNSDAGELRINHPSNATAPGALQSVTFNNVVNPEDSNTTFSLIITTYENDDYTGEIESSVVSASTSQAITVKGFVQPVLAFCVGITISGDCSTASGNNIDFGEFSPNTTSVATSQMRAHTNAVGGYVITVQGATLASGSNIIPALPSFTAPQTGTSQFGINLANNTNPDAGSDVVGDGQGSITASYTQPNQFKFESGDVLATAPGLTSDNTYTTTYITNTSPNQAAGIYSATLTYVITATF
ncbi:MAG: hypothetical protein WD061_01025 [Candidatus Saccharimonadales bacterium]